MPIDQNIHNSVDRENLTNLYSNLSQETKSFLFNNDILIKLSSYYLHGAIML